MKTKAYINYGHLNKFFIGLIILMFSNVSLAKEPDWHIYNDLLGKYVTDKSKQGITLAAVDYQGVMGDSAYQTLLAQIQSFDINQLESPQEKLAFYINAYNIFAMKMIIDHWPLKSIKDAGSLFSSVWKKNIGRLDGKNVSLHYIEHEVLRKMHEPRIHMAIVCASVSCPDLRNEAYTSQNLNAQLDEQSQRFLDNSGKGLQLLGNEINISKIFDWFEDDFSPYGGVMPFIRKYRSDLPAKVSIDSYLTYNWNLNN